MKHCTSISSTPFLPVRAADITRKQQQLDLLNNLVGTIGNIADVSIQTSSYVKSLDDND
jgi:hypothetical protein